MTILGNIKQKILNLLSDKKFSEILTGSAWAICAQTLAVIIGMFSNIIIARIYGAKTMGIVTFINSFFSLTTILTVFGTNASILRLIPEHIVKYSSTSAQKIYRKTQFLVIVASIIIGGLFFLLSGYIAERIFNKPYLSYYFSLSSVFIIFKSLALLNTEATRGLKLIRFFALMLLLPQFFNFLLLIFLRLFIFTNDIPVYALLGSLALTGLIGMGIIEVTFKKKIKPTDIIQQTSTKNILAISLPMLITATMTFVISQTGVIILGMFRSEAEIGYYGIAVKLATLTSFILAAINSMAGPKFSELYHSNKIDELFYIAKKSSKLIFYATTPILIGFIAFGKTILCLAFGNDFEAAYASLVFLVIGQFFNSISGATAYFMNMTGNEKSFKNIMLFAAIINISLNFLLIPKLGIIGAAISAMFSMILWNAITLIFIKSKFGTSTGYFPFFLKSNSYY